MRKIAAAALCLWFTLVSTSAAATELGARPYAMGGAYAAVADDLGSLVYNPAGLPGTSFEVGLGLGSNELGAIAKFLSQFSDPSSMSDGQRLHVSTLSGVSIGSFGAGIAATGTIAASQSCGAALCAKGEYSTQIVFGYGRSTLGLPFHAAGLRIGFNVKRLDGRRVEYTKAHAIGGRYEVTLDEWKGQGYSAGIGLHLTASDVIAVGLLASDLISSQGWVGSRTTAVHDDVTGEVISSSEQSLGEVRERIEPVYRVGVAVKPPLLGLTLASDLGSDGSVRYGIEKELFLGTLYVRLGGIRSKEAATTTAGLGVTLGPFRLDTAVGSSDGFATVTTMIEGSVRF